MNHSPPEILEQDLPTQTELERPQQDERHVAPLQFHESLDGSVEMFKRRLSRVPKVNAAARKRRRRKASKLARKARR